jgi:hypothetical protein
MAAQAESDFFGSNYSGTWYSNSTESEITLARTPTYNKYGMDMDKVAEHEENGYFSYWDNALATYNETSEENGYWQ